MAYAMSILAFVSVACFPARRVPVTPSRFMTHSSFFLPCLNSARQELLHAAVWPDARLPTTRATALRCKRQLPRGACWPGRLRAPLAPRSAPGAPPSSATPQAASPPCAPGRPPAFEPHLLRCAPDSLPSTRTGSLPHRALLPRRSMLGGAGLSGTLPPEIGSLSSLASLYLYNNLLSGSLPPALGSLTALKELYLFNNTFSGTIPAELSSCSSLTQACPVYPLSRPQPAAPQPTMGGSPRPRSCRCPATACPGLSPRSWALCPA